MSRTRMALAYGVMLAVVLLPFVGKCLDVDLWPFSRYSMYAATKTDSDLSVLRVYLVPRGDPLSEVALVDPRWMAPFDNSRLSRVLRSLGDGPDGQARLQRALGDLARRYEARRTAGAHSGPPLSTLRVYEASWQMQPDAGNVDTPERRTLIAELPQGNGIDSPTQP